MLQLFSDAMRITFGEIAAEMKDIDIHCLSVFCCPRAYCGTSRLSYSRHYR